MNGCRSRNDRSSTAIKRARDAPFGRIDFGGDSCLRQLDVPIAKVVPEKVVERLHDAVKLVGVKLRVDLARRLVEPRKNPAIVQRKTTAVAGKRNGNGFRAVGIHQTK